jgi:hypothetical protein
MVVNEILFKTYTSCAGSKSSSSEFLDVLMILSGKGEEIFPNGLDSKRHTSNRRAKSYLASRGSLNSGGGVAWQFITLA